MSSNNGVEYNSVFSFLHDNCVKFQEKSFKKFAVLLLAVNKENEELLSIYKELGEKHNMNMFHDTFPNSGFDLFIPKNVVFEEEVSSKFIDLEIKAEMIFYENSEFETCAYVVHPRSSISKTPIMLANHTGIIDSGYRGSLIGAFRCLKLPTFDNIQQPYVVEKNTRLLQICHPSLCRVFVCFVNESELSTTARDTGGFGSTGIIGV